MSTFTLAEVAKHTGENDTWVVVNGEVLDVTQFKKDHPGGELAIMTFAGKDATAEFNMVHPPGVVEKYLDPAARLGPVGEAAAPVAEKKPDPKPAAAAPAAAKPAGGLAAPLLPPPQDWSDMEEGWCVTIVALVWAFLMQIFGTVFFTGNFIFNNDRTGLTRSAFFLIMFMVIHAVGNLHLFLGPDDFNGYGYFYVRLYWTGFGLEANIVEEYLALAAVLHSLVAMKRTWDINMMYPVASGKLNLALSGIWLFVYMSIHLQQFRFGDTQPYAVRPPPYLINFWGILDLQLFWVKDESVPFVNVRDIYKMEFDIFKSWYNVIYYEISVVVFLAHYCWGWAKVVPSSALGIPKVRQNKVAIIGYCIGSFVALCYFSFPIYCIIVDPKPGFYGQEAALQEAAMLAEL